MLVNKSCFVHVYNYNCYIPVCIPHLQNKLWSGNPEAPTICPTICTSAMIWNIITNDYIFMSIYYPKISLDSILPIKSLILFIDKILFICSETRVMSVFNIISVIQWWLVLLVEKTGIPDKWPAASHWQTLSHKGVFSTWGCI